MVDDAIRAYDAALRAYFLAAREAGEGNETHGAGDTEGTGGDVLGAAETAADRLRATVLDHHRTWTVARGREVRPVDGE